MRGKIRKYEKRCKRKKKKLLIAITSQYLVINCFFFPIKYAQTHWEGARQRCAASLRLLE